jgi:dihydrofolate reductase
MRKLIAFIITTVDGYFEGPNREFDWPNIDAEFVEFSVSQLDEIGILIFGRTTYEGMAAYWPTEAAKAAIPAIAERMNRLPKIVVSTSLRDPGWAGSEVLGEDVGRRIAELKHGNGKHLAILGSAALTAVLLEQGLIDELRVMVHPILLGAGHSLLAGLHRRVPLALARSTVFASGSVLLCYRPAAESPASSVT